MTGARPPAVKWVVRAAMTSRRVAALAGAWLATWAAMVAVWLLLVDITTLPELLTGAAVGVIAATGSELVRAQGIARARPPVRALARAWRPIARGPLDVALVVLAIAGRRQGRVRALPFRHGGDDPAATGRRAMAEGLGSFAPNTIVIGVDPDRDLILAHQLVPTRRTTQAIDPLELG
jgi:multisubunit Na+/H+ antiporter MnhE subunit